MYLYAYIYLCGLLSYTKSSYLQFFKNFLFVSSSRYSRNLSISQLIGHGSEGTFTKARRWEHNGLQNKHPGIERKMLARGFQLLAIMDFLIILVLQ